MYSEAKAGSKRRLGPQSSSQVASSSCLLLTIQLMGSPLHMHFLLSCLLLLSVGDDLALIMFGVLSLTNLLSQHPVESRRTHHTETLMIAELQKGACKLDLEEPPPLLTGRSMWRF